MKVNIRHEETRDYKIVENITREAFWNLYYPGCNEHYIVNKLRSHKDFIPDLSFVIELEGKVVGSIFYSKSKICLDHNRELDVLTFGPLSILPKHQGIGLGYKLITHSINAAKDKGYGAIVILGFPEHYINYGFVGGKKYNISMEDGEFYKCLLALPIKEGYLDNIKGYIKFSDVFNVCESDVDMFDKQNFEHKEKILLDKHKEFEKMAYMVDL